MRKNFIANLGILLFLNFLVKPFWILGVDRTVQNVVGPEQYGIYFALFNFSFLFQVVLDFGINNFNNRRIARQHERLGQYLCTTLVAKLVLSVLYVILVFVFAIGVHFSGYQLSVLLLMIAMQIVISFYSFMRSNVAALQLFKTDAVLSVLDKLITSCLCIAILWGPVHSVSMSITTFIWLQIIGYSTALIVALIILLNQSVKIEWKFRFNLMKRIIIKSYPYALLGFLMTAYYRIDGVMIERMLGDNGSYEAGVYASAFRLLDSMNILGFLFAGILLPLFSKMIEKKESVQSLIELSYKLVLVFSATAGITCIFFRNQIMQLLYVSSDADSGNILGWLMVSFICISVIYIYGSLLTANGNIRLLNKISLAGMAVNILLNVLLIPRYHALGSAAATVVTQILVLGGHIAIAHKEFKIPFRNKIWGQSLVFILFICGINLLLSKSGITWYYAMLGCVTAGMLFSFTSGLFKIKEVAGSLREALSAAGRRN